MAKLILESEPEPDLTAVVTGYNGDIGQLQAAVCRARAGGTTLRQVIRMVERDGAPARPIGLTRDISEQATA